MRKTEKFVLAGLFIILVSTVTFSNGSFTNYLLNSADESFRLTALMAWETWWALVLGFAVAGAVEAWIPEDKIIKGLDSSFSGIGRGTFFGFISSSCSFSAVATAKNLFKKGASASASLAAFMFASTNLVIELGAVMWVLLGWQFVLANIAGGLIMILLLGAFLEFLVPEEVVKNARENLVEKEGIKETDPVCGMDVDVRECDEKITVNGKTYYFCCESCKNAFKPEKDGKTLKDKFTSLEGWKELASIQWKEWKMLFDDIAIGLVISGIIGGFVPSEVWNSLFLTGTGITGLIFSAIIGALVGSITFVCSVGNVPFAAVLWNSGVPFGALFSYIYSDLIVPPIVDAYRKYYGKTFAAVLTGGIFAAAVISGVATHMLFSWMGLIPETAARIAEKTFELNYTFILNTVFTIVFITLYRIKDRQG